MKKPTTSQKYLALAIILPVLADFIEDLRDTNVFKHSLKMKANLLLSEIRIADSKFYERGAFGNISDEEYIKRITAIADQQVIGGISFRQWVASEFIDPYEEGSVHSDDSSNNEKQEGGEENKEGTLPDDSKRTKRNSTGKPKKSAKDAVKE
jgi:hypothetical protein